MTPAGLLPFGLIKEIRALLPTWLAGMLVLVAARLFGDPKFYVLGLLACGFGAGRWAVFAPCPLRRAPTSRTTKRTAITGAVANSQIRIHGVEASVPAPRVWATASA